MTEAEWETCAFPGRMLDHLVTRGGTTDRKLRLVACACLRLVWDSLPGPSVRAAVEVGEGFLDGEASLEELNTARERAAPEASGMSRSFWFGNEPTSRDVWYAVAMDRVGRRLDDVVAHYTWVNSSTRGVLAFRTRRRESQLLRDIFGNPFRAPAIEPGWRSETARSLAVGIYADRAFDRLPILADALEEAGCDDAVTLSHCRGPGPHARGCWVVDLVLDKQ